MEVCDSSLSLNLNDSIDTLKALASEPRGKILALIKRSPMNINEITERLDLPQSTVATNILILEKAGLITTECIKGRKGLQKRCSLTFSQILVRIE